MVGVETCGYRSNFIFPILFRVQRRIRRCAGKAQPTESRGESRGYGLEDGRRWDQGIFYSRCVWDPTAVPPPLLPFGLSTNHHHPSRESSGETCRAGLRVG